jgi:hypothetical protein
MSTMNLMDAFFLGAVTGALLTIAVVVAAKQPRRRVRGDGESERQWMRAVDEAFAKGREEGLEMRLPKPVLTIEQTGRGWRGTTRGAPIIDRGEGAA